MSADSGRLLLATDLLRHLAEQLSPRLPGGRTLLANGATLLITSGNGQRVLATETITIPEIEDRASISHAAARMLSEAQDLIAYHLMTSWPIDSEGRAGHPMATIDGEQLNLGFRRADGGEVLLLEPYSLPDESAEPIISG